MKREKLLSVAVGVLTALVCAALCACVLTLYASGLQNRAETGSAFAPIFTREAVARQLLWVCPALALWLIAVIIAGAYNEKQGKKRPAPARIPIQWLPMQPIREAPKTAVLRGALYAAAVLFIVLGVLNGGLHDVLVKAIHICTECIGLG